MRQMTTTLMSAAVAAFCLSRPENLSRTHKSPFPDGDLLAIGEQQDLEVSPLSRCKGFAFQWQPCAWDLSVNRENSIRFAFKIVRLIVLSTSVNLRPANPSGALKSSSRLFR